MAARAKKADEPAQTGSKAPGSKAPGLQQPGFEKPGFEQRLEALEAIVRELEGEGLTLEQSLARYQQGVEHLTACRALLDGAEKRLVELAERPDGSARERPLKVTEQGVAPDMLAGNDAGSGADDAGDDNGAR